jgi:hypothetical protein
MDDVKRGLGLYEPTRRMPFCPSEETGFPVVQA